MGDRRWWTAAQLPAEPSSCCLQWQRRQRPRIRISLSLFLSSKCCLIPDLFWESSSLSQDLLQSEPKLRRLSLGQGCMIISAYLGWAVVSSATLPPRRWGWYGFPKGDKEEAASRWSIYILVPVPSAPVPFSEQLYRSPLEKE